MSLLRKKRDAQICEMRRQEATYEEIGNAFNITRQRAFQIVKERCPQVDDEVLDKDLTQEYTHQRG